MLCNQLSTQCHRSAGSFYHAQENAYYCGAAVAMIMLSDPNVGLPPSDTSQLDIYNGARMATLCAGFEICPEGLSAVLNNKRPSSYTRTFRRFDEPDPSKATSDIVSCITSPDPVAPAILVLGDRHWVTVNGIDIVQGSREGEYLLLDLWLYDPEAKSYPAGPHANPDNCLEFGIRDYAVFYPQGWQHFFSGWFPNGPSGGRMFTYVAPAPETRERLKVPNEIKSLDLGHVPRRSNGLIKKNAAAMGMVLDAWRRASGGLPADSPAARVFDANAMITHVAEVTEPNYVCYLVLIGSEQSTLASLYVDARGGWPLSIKLHRAGSRYQTDYTRLKTEFVERVLYWEPCLESFSPHLPFIRHPDGRFERLDRRLFTGLTREVKGA